MICKSLLLLLSIVILLCIKCDGTRRWDYEPLSLDSYTSDPNKMYIKTWIKRTPQGEYAYEGEIVFAYEVDDTTMVEATAFRSQSGRDNDYQPMPWTVAKQTYAEFIEGYYDDMIYSNLKDCSNMPKPEDVFPIHRANYTFRNCIVEGDGLPEMAPQGYYKVLLNVTGEVDWGFVAYSRITDKWMP